MDLQLQQTDLQDIFTERTSGAPHPGSWMRVESIISQRGETWKSKALLIYHFKYILFVSSWKFSLFLEFYWLLPSICLLHDAAFCRRFGWWSCVMVTVLLKKRNRQRCLILKHFPGCKCQGDRSYLGNLRENVCFSARRESLTSNRGAFVLLLGVSLCHAGRCGRGGAREERPRASAALRYILKAPLTQLARRGQKRRGDTWGSTVPSSPPASRRINASHFSQTARGACATHRATSTWRYAA